jgi:hypothetical protein
MEANKSLPEDMPEFRNDYIHLIIDEENSLMYSEWLRKPTSEEYREAMRIVAGYMQDKNVEFWIQDTNRLGEVPSADLAMLLQALMPIFSSSSLKKLARITSDEKNLSSFLEMAARMKVKLNTSIEIQQFKTYREAADWLNDSDQRGGEQDGRHRNVRTFIGY